MPQDYSPKYIGLDEVPVQIPDDYSELEKRDALEYAEALLEIDINGGNELTADEVTPAVEAALKQKATCELAKGSEHPDDTALGDLEDTGSTKVDYAVEAFCDRYDELVDRINDSGEGDEELVGPYVYNTEEPDRPEDWQDRDVWMTDG